MATPTDTEQVVLKAIADLSQRMEVGFAEVKGEIKVIDQKIVTLDGKLSGLDDRVKALDSRIWAFAMSSVWVLDRNFHGQGNFQGEIKALFPLFPCLVC